MQLGEHWFEYWAMTADWRCSCGRRLADEWIFRNGLVWMLPSLEKWS